jgi:hypothetical protein
VVRVTEADTGAATAARVRLIDVARQKPAPPPREAIAVLYHNLRETRTTAQPDGAFYAEGGFRMDLQPGRYRLTVTKGLEYLDHRQEIEVGPEGEQQVEIALQRWAHPQKDGWFSADAHIHLPRGPRDDEAILSWVAAEGLDIGILLEWGDHFGTYDHQHAHGTAGVFAKGGRFIASGQEEPRSYDIGHTMSFGADEFVRFADTYFDFPRVFDRVRQLNGLTGYAHQAVLANGHRGFTMDALAGRLDFLELLQFSFAGPIDTPLRPQHYYTMLDLGIKLTATAGSDFPFLGKKMADNKRLPQIGNVRFYTHLDGPLTYQSWRDAVRAGRTCVTSGPLLELTVNGRRPGDEVLLKRGEKVRVTARARGHATQVPLRELKIIGHGGETLHRVTAAGDRTSLMLDEELDLPHGTWIAAVADAGETQVAHTTPVYVRVAGGGFHNPQTVQQSLDLCEAHLRDMEKALDEPAKLPRDTARLHRDTLNRRIAETRQTIGSLREKLNSKP